ncbi:MAG TPA: lysophospholipid acyltransferase family protein [Methylomirabilota bacterium]|nr:lysophospholipid acyltransferase family protein [Methylomirabilota bacterium]
MTTAPTAHGASQEPLSADTASVPNAHWPKLSLSRRIQIPIIAAAVWSVIRLLGPTLRFEVHGWQHAERLYAQGKRCIWTFWHRSMLATAYWGRHRGVVVMATANFDGRWGAKVIEWLGFGTVAASSTRGGARGLAELAQKIKEGRDAGFAIDGPRGPRFIAKPGAVLLARRTSQPVMPFHVAVDRGRTFERSWDHFLLPKPFARTVMLFAPPIFVPEDASPEMITAKLAEVQKELDRTRELAESWYSLPAEERARHAAEFDR